MSKTEIDSFVAKFHQLWKAGVAAHLDLDTQAGYAWVGLHVQLGQAPSHVHPAEPCHQRERRNSETRSKKKKVATTTAVEARDEDNASERVVCSCHYIECRSPRRWKY